MRHVPIRRQGIGVVAGGIPPGGQRGGLLAPLVSPREGGGIGPGGRPIRTGLSGVFVGCAPVPGRGADHLVPRLLQQAAIALERGHHQRPPRVIHLRVPARTTDHRPRPGGLPWARSGGGTDSIAAGPMSHRRATGHHGSPSSARRTRRATARNPPTRASPAGPLGIGGTLGATAPQGFARVAGIGRATSPLRCPAGHAGGGGVFRRTGRSPRIREAFSRRPNVAGSAASTRTSRPARSRTSPHQRPVAAPNHTDTPGNRRPSSASTRSTSNSTWIPARAALTAAPPRARRPGDP